MKKMVSLAILGAFAVLAGPVFAVDAVRTPGPIFKMCEDQAAKKKLSGKEEGRFSTKCAKDWTDAAYKSCDAQSAEKKLFGEAKQSFTKKCVKDAVAALATGAPAAGAPATGAPATAPPKK